MILWNGLSKSAFILVCNFPIFREKTFLSLFICWKGLAYPAEACTTFPSKTVIMFPPALYRKTLLSHLLSLSCHKVSHPLTTETFWSALTVELITRIHGIHYLCSVDGVSRHLMEIWAPSGSKVGHEVNRISGPLCLSCSGQCRWAAGRMLISGLCWCNVCCDYCKGNWKKKICPLQYSYSLSPATWVSSPCKFWGQELFTRCPVRTRCKTGY